jgi:predicted nuclease of predicted toxin-antitoxin system
MRFIADENVPASAVSALSAAGHDVKWVRKNAPGSRDDDVLAVAAREERTLVTFDKDFGELAWRYPLPRDCGIILFRLPMTSPSAVARVIVDAIAMRTDWAGHFSVVEPSRVRMRPLPRRIEQ